MSSVPFEPLQDQLDAWFEKDEAELPPELRHRMADAFSPLTWRILTPTQRRQLAVQHDIQHDPALEPERQFWWEHHARVAELQAQADRWQLAQAGTAGDLALKEGKLREIADELKRLEALAAADQHRHDKARKQPREAPDGPKAPRPDEPQDYVPYPRALKLLADRLDATADELAAWVFLGKDLGGLDAYWNANELNPPTRFSYAFAQASEDPSDYLTPLMSTWFSVAELTAFEPQERFITAPDLIRRWGSRPGLVPRAFIVAKVRESRLRELHPVLGLTQATLSEANMVSMDVTLFHLADVEGIEREDFGDGPAPVSDAPQVAELGGEPATAVGPEPTVPRADWARGWEAMTPDQRTRCVVQRKLALRRAGTKAWLKTLAEEAGVSTKRIQQILDRHQPGNPFLGALSPLPQDFSSPRRKDKG